jgi:anti-anti-sigma regulatory factor
MFVTADPAMTVVRLDGRFDAPQARSLESLFSLFTPLRRVVIDFANVREADDAAVASLARTLASFRDSRVTFRGLSRHLRRVLRYVGIDIDGTPERGGEWATGEADRPCPAADGG